MKLQIELIHSLRESDFETVCRFYFEHLSSVASPQMSETNSETKPQVKPAKMAHASKIYIAGHCGLAGSAIERRLRAEGFVNIVSNP